MEEKVRIYTNNVEAKRTILKVMQEEMGFNVIIPNDLEMEFSIYNEAAMHIVQELILKNQISLVTLENADKPKKERKKIVRKKEEKSKGEGDKKTVRGRRTNKMIGTILSLMQKKKQVTMKELIEYTGASYTGIRTNLNKLVEENKIVYVERGIWRLKNFYDDCLELPEYKTIVDYITDYKTIAKEKLISKFEEEKVETVIKELIIGDFLHETENDKYEVSLSFRVWYLIKQKPHIQWPTLKVRMAERLIDANTLSSTLNALERNNKVKKDGKRGYVIV